MPKRHETAEPRRSPLNLKTTASLRAKIEEACRLSGRCLTEEVEHRVERSFLMDDIERATRETIRQEMRAEFEARGEKSEAFAEARREWARQMDEICGPRAYNRINGMKAD